MVSHGMLFHEILCYSMRMLFHGIPFYPKLFQARPVLLVWLTIQRFVKEARPDEAEPAEGEAPAADDAPVPAAPAG